MADDDRKQPDQNESQPESEDFDAVAAAAELEDSLHEGAEADAGATDGYIEILETEVGALNDELARARARVEKAEERAERARDEVERSKDRLARESGRDLERRTRDILGAFLDVLDDLDRAIESAREMDHNPDVVAGVELVRRRFVARLDQMGVQRRPSLGEPFDPNVHEAVSSVPVSEPSQDGVVVGVVSEGYDIGDEVLRPARVAVGRKSPL